MTRRRTMGLGAAAALAALAAAPALAQQAGQGTWQDQQQFGQQRYGQQQQFGQQQFGQQQFGQPRLDQQQMQREQQVGRTPTGQQGLDRQWGLDQQRRLGQQDQFGQQRQPGMQPTGIGQGQIGHMGQVDEWVRVAIDLNNDGRFDTAEYIHISDLVRARNASGMRMQETGMMTQPGMDRQFRTQWDQQRSGQQPGQFQQQQRFGQTGQYQQRGVYDDFDRRWQEQQQQRYGQQRWGQQPGQFQQQPGQFQQQQRDFDRQQFDQQWQQRGEFERQRQFQQPWQQQPQRFPQQRQQQPGTFTDDYYGETLGMQQQLGGQQLGQRPGQQFGQQQPGMGMQQQQQFRGEIRSLESIQLTGIRDRHTIATIETDRGQVIPVDLGPERNLRHLNLREGREISLVGSRGMINDRPVLMATQLQSDGRTAHVNRAMGTEQLQRFDGQVVQTWNDAILDTNRQHQLALVQLDRGPTVVVDLGPTEQVRRVNVAENARISLLAQPGMIDGQRALFAKAIAGNGQSVNIERIAQQQHIRTREGVENVVYRQQQPGFEQDRRFQQDQRLQQQQQDQPLYDRGW